MRIPAALAVAAALAGCVDLSSPHPDRRFYALEAARSGPARPAPAGLLRLRRFQASRGAEATEFSIRSGENAWEADFYNGFFTPPASQVAEQTARWLAASGLYGLVSLGGSAAEETQLLEGNLVSLHADRRDAGKPAAVIELQFALFSSGIDVPALVFQKAYRKSTSVPDSTPEALVRGWNAGLAEVLREFEEDLSKAPRAPK